MESKYNNIITGKTRFPEITALFAFVRARERRVMDREEVLKALDAGSKNFSDFVVHISKFDIGSYIASEIKIEPSTPPRIFESVALKFFEQEAKMIRDYTPKPCSDIIELFLEKYDAYNIISVINSLRTHSKPLHLIPIGKIAELNILDKLETAKTEEEVLGIAKQCGLYWILKSLEKSPSEFSIICSYFSELKKLCKDLKPSMNTMKAIEHLVNTYMLERSVLFLIENKAPPTEFLLCTPHEISEAFRDLTRAIDKLKYHYFDIMKKIEPYIKKTKEDFIYLRFLIEDYAYTKALELLSTDVLSFDSVLRYVALREYEARLVSLAYTALYLGKARKVLEVLSS